MFLCPGVPPRPVPRGASARCRRTERGNDAQPTPHPPPPPPHLRGWRARSRGAPAPQPPALGRRRRSGAPGLRRLRAGLGPVQHVEERGAAGGAGTRSLDTRPRGSGTVSGSVCVHFCARVCAAAKQERALGRGRQHGGQAGARTDTGHGQGAEPDAQHGAILRAQQLPRTQV